MARRTTIRKRTSRRSNSNLTSHESCCAPFQNHALSNELSSLVKAISGTGDSSLDNTLLKAILKRTSESSTHIQDKQQQNNQISLKSPCAPQNHALSNELSSLVKAISGTGDGLVDDALLQAILKRTSESPIHTQGKQHRQSGPPSSHTQQHPPSNATSSQPSHNKQQQQNNQAFKLPCTHHQEITKHAQSNTPLDNASTDDSLVSSVTSQLLRPPVVAKIALSKIISLIGVEAGEMADPAPRDPFVCFLKSRTAVVGGSGGGGNSEQPVTGAGVREGRGKNGGSENGVTGGGVSNTGGKSKESDVSVMSAGVVMAVTAPNDSLIKALTSRIAARVHPSKTETGVDKSFVGNITSMIARAKGIARARGLLTNESLENYIIRMIAGAPTKRARENDGAVGSGKRFKASGPVELRGQPSGINDP